MPPAIETKGLTKRFGTTTALADLTLDIEAGEVFGFLGPNGAGKTTTVRLLLGLLRPTSGSSRVVGLDTWADPVEVHRHVAYVPGEFAVWPMLTGAETLELLGSLHGDVDLAYQRELCERFDFDPSRKARSYSKGNRQKIALVAALSTRAPVLILDEPTAGLDPLKEVTFRDCVSEARDRGQTVFLSSHILSEVEALCDRVGILRAGKLVDVGPLAEMRHLSSQRVEVTFAGNAPDLRGLLGVDHVVVNDRTVRLQIRGNANELIRKLAAYDVVSFTSQEPSLEEVFLAHYGPADGVDAGVPDSVR